MFDQFPSLKAWLNQVGNVAHSLSLNTRLLPEYVPSHSPGQLLQYAAFPGGFPVVHFTGRELARTLFDSRTHGSITIDLPRPGR